jgi:nucleoside-triphosphatase
MLVKDEELKGIKTRNVIKNILITGNPGVGKTTLIQSIISKLNIPAGGFYTAEVRDENGKRWGFKIIAVADGREDVLASVDTISQRRVSKYGVNVVAIDRIGVTAVRDALSRDGIVVIDEIGRMELASKQFRDVVLEALDSPKPVLGTIAIKDTSFAEKIKKRQDTRIIKLTRVNFPEVATHIERLLSKSVIRDP